jgi:5-methylthioadenosine/S-adenosylhomocysteine deaminase
MHPPADLLIRDVALFDPAADGMLEHRDIVLGDGTIVSIDPHDDDVSAQTVVDGRGKLAIPGLVNAHAHSAMTLLRGVAEDVSVETWFNDIVWRLEANLSEGDAYWGMKLAAVELIEAGVTCVADHYFHMDAIARACEEAGLRAHLAPTLFGNDPESELAHARAFVERWHGAAGGRIRAWLGPHSPYLCSGDFLRRCRDEAASLGVGVHLHLSETRSQLERSLDEHGLTPPAYLERLGLMEVPLLCAHATHATPDDIALLGRYGVGVAHCPKTFLKLASGIADITAMLEQGVKVGLGSDGAASNNTLDILEQARLAALLQKHEHHDATLLPRREALQLATYGGAAALGQGHELGRLEPGYLADIVLVDLTGAHLQPLHDVAAALLYAARASDVDTVIVQGQVLMQERELTTLDKAEVVTEAARRGLRLARSPKAERIQTFPGGA